MSFHLTPQRVLLPLLGALLTACAVGPDYRPPATTMPAAWANAAPTAASQPSVTNPGAAEMTQWWTAFADPQLDKLIQLAVASNLDLKAATARLRQARAQRGVTAADFWPGVNLDAAATRSRSGPADASSGNGASTTSNLFQAGFDATWELDVFGGVRRNIEAADYNIGAAIENRRDVLVTLFGEVATDYLQLRGYQRQLAVAQANLKAQQHTEQITEKKRIGGLAAGLDVANAQAQVATTAAAIPVLETQIRQTIHALSILLAREPGALVEQLSTPAPLPALPPQIPIGLPSDLLRRRPDIRQAERQLASATAAVGAAAADLFPKFSLTGSLGLQSEKFHPLWDYASNYWSIGPSVSWPLFDAGRIRANIAVQAALRDQSFIAYQQAVLNALQDVENALTAYNHEQQHHQTLQDAVAFSRRAVDLSTQLYTQGLTDFLNVLTAQLQLYTTETALAQSDAALATDLVALYKALGGGWEEGVRPGK